MNHTFFEKLWLTKLHYDIYTELLKLWVQPASTIANHLGIERTKTYRYLLKLSEIGLIKKTQKNSIIVFFIKDLGDLEKYIDKTLNNFEYISTNKKDIIDELRKKKLENTNTPKTTIYDNASGVGNIFDDIIESIKVQKLLTIRLFASNTYLEQNENIVASEYAQNFFKNLGRLKIFTDVLLGSGNLIMERIDANFEHIDISELPATSSSINVIIVGKVIYIITYDKTPQWIKIENENLADAMHILFDTAKRLDVLQSK